MDIPPGISSTESTRAVTSARVRSSGISCGLEQEPGAPLSLIDPDLDQARARHIAVLVAKPMRLPEVCGKLLVVVAELGKHVHRCDEIGIVVEDALQTTDVADGTHGGATNLANAFCN